MNEIRIEFPPEAIRKFTEAIGEHGEAVTLELQRLVTRSTFRIGATARQLAPVKFGRLRQSIAEKIGKLSGEVTVNVDYAGAVEFGSKPHVILPRKKRALAFKPGGGFRFWDESGRIVVRRVKHPGTRPQPFLTPAVNKEAPLFTDAIRRIVENPNNKAR